jgi:putative GTP pyrophosphokinase
MTNVPSNTQVDRLGERLKTGNLEEADLTLLDDYRRSFGPAYEDVVDTLRRLGVQPTGRPAKSTPSLVAKMNRETIRLSQVQDIAGCRVLVADLDEQERLVAALTRTFPKVTVVDRREKPTHGYRAVHVIIELLDRSVEVQVRTELQHTWAELSEKLSDLVDASIKYGGGPTHVKDRLLESSSALGSVEQALRLLAEAIRTMEEEQETEETRRQVEAAREQMPTLKAALVAALKAAAETWISDTKDRT